MDSFSHKYGESTYHFVFVTKCRYKVLRSRGHKYICRDILQAAAKRHSIAMRNIGLGDDHVHMVATIPPSMSVCKAFQLLKGASSWAMFRAVPDLHKRYPRGSFWSRGGTFRSIGDVDAGTVADYVESHNQLALSQFMSPNSAGFSPQ